MEKYNSYLETVLSHCFNLLSIIWMKVCCVIVLSGVSRIFIVYDKTVIFFNQKKDRLTIIAVR